MIFSAQKEPLLRFDGFGLTDTENSGIVGMIWHQKVPKGENK